MFRFLKNKKKNKTILRLILTFLWLILTSSILQYEEWGIYRLTTAIELIAVVTVTIVTIQYVTLKSDLKSRDKRREE